MKVSLRVRGVERGKATRFQAECCGGDMAIGDRLWRFVTPMTIEYKDGATGHITMEIDQEFEPGDVGDGKEPVTREMFGEILDFFGLFPTAHAGDPVRLALEHVIDAYQLVNTLKIHVGKDHPEHDNTAKQLKDFLATLEAAEKLIKRLAGMPVGLPMKETE